MTASVLRLKTVPYAGGLCRNPIPSSLPLWTVGTVYSFAGGWSEQNNSIRDTPILFCSKYSVRKNEYFILNRFLIANWEFVVLILIKVYMFWQKI